MGKLACAFAALILAACAGQQAAPPPPKPKPQVTSEADGKTRADIHTQLGAAYYGIGNLGVALEELNEALRADPDHGSAHNMLGLVYMELREDVRAEASFKRALTLNPQDSDANNNYGWFLCQRKRHEDGIKHFMIALKNPLYAAADKSFVNAGICSRERGDEKAAAEFFDRALRVQPMQPQALLQLADMAFRRNDLANARSYLARLSKTGLPLNAEALWLALRVERRLGDRDAEASYGMQLRRNFPNSRETQSLLNRQFE